MDEEGNLRQNIRDVIDLCKEHSLILGTGHGSTAEALAAAGYAKSVGFKKLVFTHPHVGISEVTDKQYRAFLTKMYKTGAAMEDLKTMMDVPRRLLEAE